MEALEIIFSQGDILWGFLLNEVSAFKERNILSVGGCREIYLEVHCGVLSVFSLGPRQPEIFRRLWFPQRFFFRGLW